MSAPSATHPVYIHSVWVVTNDTKDNFPCFEKGEMIRKMFFGMNVQVFIWSEMQLVTRHLQVMVILGYTANILRHIIGDLQFFSF